MLGKVRGPWDCKRRADPHPFVKGEGRFVLQKDRDFSKFLFDLLKKPEKFAFMATGKGFIREGNNVLTSL